MGHITLAQTTLSISHLRTAAFWAELDSGICRLHGTTHIHDSGYRHYRLSALELHVTVLCDIVTATWLSASAVIDVRGRIELRQTADVWLDTLAALMMPPSPVAARVQAASALLAAGFESVAVTGAGGGNSVTVAVAPTTHKPTNQHSAASIALAA